MSEFSNLAYQGAGKVLKLQPHLFLEFRRKSRQRSDRQRIKIGGSPLKQPLTLYHHFSLGIV